MMGVLLIAMSVQALRSTPDLGTANAACRPDEPGPAVMILAEGLKDRSGLLRAELYPANDRDFLADDNILVSQGKTFRRVTIPVPSKGPVNLCIRAPAPGIYALALLHDRNGDGKFSILQDGFGFPGNPRLGWSRPRASSAAITVGSAVGSTSIVFNYKRGLLSFGPIDEPPQR